MDSETRISQLEQRVAALEHAAETMTERFKSALAELEEQPMIGGIVRMFKNRVIRD